MYLFVEKYLIVSCVICNCLAVLLKLTYLNTKK